MDPSPDTTPPNAPLAAVGLRLLMIQASWNDRTLIGNGFAWALLPILRKLGPQIEDMNEVVRRHSGSFNSHPYLVGIAVGAVARSEADGADPTAVDRFKTILRSPLGAMGDALVWAGVLPLFLLAAVALGLLGAAPAIVLAVFVVGFNAIHIGLRVWGLRLGWRHGLGAGEAVLHSGLRAFASRAGQGAAGMLGVVVGLIVVTAAPTLGARGVWMAALVGAVLVGYRFGSAAARVGAVSLLGLLLYLGLSA